MKSIILLLITLSLISSCSTLSTPGLKSRNIEDYYTPTGVEKYFLNDLPGWANFDQRAQCFRSTQIRYFNLGALMKSYGLNYNKAIQVQAAYNEELAQFKGTDAKRTPTLKEEELLFYKVSEKVNSKIIFFDPPAFKRVHLIWLDEIINDPKKEKKLENLINSRSMDAGVPVLVSLCYTRGDLEEKYSKLNAKMITAEMFSVYDQAGNMNPSFSFDLEPFFSKDQVLFLYTQKNPGPFLFLKGNIRQQSY